MTIIQLFVSYLPPQKQQHVQYSSTIAGIRIALIARRQYHSRGTCPPPAGEREAKERGNGGAITGKRTNLCEKPLRNNISFTPINPIHPLLVWRIECKSEAEALLVQRGLWTGIHAGGCLAIFGNQATDRNGHRRLQLHGLLLRTDWLWEDTHTHGATGAGNSYLKEE